MSDELKIHINIKVTGRKNAAKQQALDDLVSILSRGDFELDAVAGKRIVVLDKETQFEEEQLWMDVNPTKKWTDRQGRRSSK